MKINSKKSHLSCIRVFFIMSLFVMCFTMNVLFSSAYNFYELLDKTTAIETWTISENNTANENGDNTACFKASFLNKSNSDNETITKNTYATPMIVAIPQGISLLLFLVIVFLYFFLTLFILLPDSWTLINHKVRLNN